MVTYIKVTITKAYQLHLKKLTQIKKIKKIINLNRYITKFHNIDNSKNI